MVNGNYNGNVKTSNANGSPFDLLGHHPPLACMCPSMGPHVCLLLQLLWLLASICVKGSELMIVLHS